MAEQVVLPPFQSQPCEGLRSRASSSIPSCCEFGARNPCLPLLASPSQLVSIWLCARINAPPSAGVAQAWELKRQRKSIYCLTENCPVMLSTHSTAGFVSSSSYMSVGSPTERHHEMCQVLLLSKHLGRILHPHAGHIWSRSPTSCLNISFKHFLLFGFFLQEYEKE